LNKKSYSTVNELMDYAFAEYKKRPAYTSMDHTLTYGELDELSDRFASYLQNQTSLKPGDRIAIQLPNVLQFPIVLFGAVKAGVVIVNTNPLYTCRELKHQLNDSGAKVLVVLANVANTAAEIITETGVEQVIVTQVGDCLPFVKRHLVNFVVKKVKKLIPDYNFPSSVDFNKAIALGNTPVNKVKTPADSTLVLQYTGGTTGTAKGAMLTHSNLCANVSQLTRHLNKLFSPDEVLLVAALPLYHIFAFNAHVLLTLTQGAHNLLIPNPRDIPAFVKALKGKTITGFIGLNTLYNALLRNEEFCQLDFSNLTTSAAGGMAITKDVAQRWQKVTKCAICEGYGLTETSPVLASNPEEDVRIGSIGIPLPDTELKIIDLEGNTLSAGEEGELCARGPQVMPGYWNRPEETRKVLDEDGWFKTGDIATSDDDGYYKIVDRKKDMVLVSGFNVYPNEIEDYVSQHPQIVEAAVVGVPDKETGEAVKLFVVTNCDSMDKNEIIEFCREGLTGYKIPRLIEFKEELPKSNVGKILRRELRDTESI